MSDHSVEEKLYVFLGVDGQRVKFLKPTSQTKIYDVHGDKLLSGCVVYAAGQIPGLNKPRTIIDASKPWGEDAKAVADTLARDPWRVTGRVMPADFDDRLRRAIRQAKGLSDDDRAALLALIDASAPAPPSSRSRGAS